MANDFEEFAVAPPPEKAKAFIRERWNPDFNDETGAALYWLFYNRLFFDMGLIDDDRILLTWYQLMVTEPEKQFRIITDFLGIQYEEALAADIFSSSLGRSESPAIDESIRADCEVLMEELCNVVKSRQ